MGRVPITAEQYTKNWRTALDKILAANPKAKVIVALSTPCCPIPSMTENNQKVDRMNEALRQLLNDYPVVEVDDLHEFGLKNSPLTAYMGIVHFTPAYSQRLAQKYAM